MKRTAFLILAINLMLPVCLCGQTSYQVVVPGCGDRFCEYVKKLEAGETNIDYQDFRFSFVESEQFKIAKSRSSEFDDLKKEMYNQMRKSNYQDIIRITKQMLSIDYTSMIAHKILRQTYKLIDDTANASRYKKIQFGLLNSIVKKGDGKTCATAWPVIQTEEEYFILEILDATLKEQSVDKEGGLCDKMDVRVEGEKRTYYFETSKVFEGYKKAGIK